MTGGSNERKMRGARKILKHTAGGTSAIVARKSQTAPLRRT